MTYRLYASAYTGDLPDQGIRKLAFDGHSLTELETYGPAVNPSYLYLSEDAVYAVEETENQATVLKLSADSQVPQRLHIPGRGLCHIIGIGDYLYAAGYTGGCITGISKKTGQPVCFVEHTGKGVNPDRQEASHVHFVSASPDGRHLLVADLGLDRIFQYDIQADGTLTPNPKQPSACSEPGQGPRHFVFHPNGNRLYLATELDSSIMVYDYDSEQSVLSNIGKYPLACEGSAATAQAADIHISADGKFLYASVRGQDKLVCFAVSEDGKHLTRQEIVSCGGCCPRSFALSPDETYIAVANQTSGELVILSRNTQTGVVGAPVARYAFPCVACVKWEA